MLKEAWGEIEGADMRKYEEMAMEDQDRWQDELTDAMQEGNLQVNQCS